MRRANGEDLPSPDFFDLAGSDPELLNSGRIPDPQPGHTALFRWLARVFTAVEARLRARGKASVRFGIRFLWGLVALVSLFLLFGPVINAPLDFDDVIADAEIGEVDWIARDVAVDYAVDRDGAGAFAAQISEQYTAHFVNGAESSIERAFVTEFEGHESRFELHDATIGGAPADVEVERRATVTRVTISRGDGRPLEGEQEVALSYELHDLAVSDTDQATGREVDRWSWPVLGPSWPQATKGVEVSLTLAPELDDALIRSPRAYVGWLLVSGTEWLEPEGETAQGVRYSFGNDDTLPPHADLTLDARFEAGTFDQPPTTPLFWVQTWGPLIPLALLGVLLLFALAARRVVWADSAGESWYLPRADPPKGLSPMQAAQLLGRPRHAELVAELGSGPPAPRKKPTSRMRSMFGARRSRRSAQQAGRTASAGRARERWIADLARVGMRAGRIGAFPSTARSRGAWARRDWPVEQGLRWVPDSYLRDTFVFGSLAIALLQWALLRQLSHQVILTVVWWPGLFVLVSTALAIATIWAVSRPRPLTRKGALALQELKGIDAWARATRLLDRGPVDDPLLPYAALFESPRRAGRRVVEHAVSDSGDRRIMRGWRGEHYVSLPAVLALVAAVAVLAGSIVTVSTRPVPYGEERFVTWPSVDEVPGSTWSQVEGIEVEAELERDDAGRARLSVVERDAVRFAPGGSSVPQFVREWPRERLGQSLGVEIESVRIDGREVAFREIDGVQSVAMTTELSEVLDGLYDVEVAYALTNPVVDAVSDSEPQQQLRWTAWYRFWDDTYYSDFDRIFGGSEPVRPLSLQLTIAPDVAREIRAGGWIDYDGERERVRYESGQWYGSWEYEDRTFLGDGLEDSRPYDLRIGTERRLGDGSLVVALDAETVESREAEDFAEEIPPGPWQISDEVNETLGKHELGLSGDWGVRLDFAPGTFADIDAGAYERYVDRLELPYRVLIWFAAIVTVAAGAVLIRALRMRRAASASLRTVAFGAIPILAIAQSVLFGWTIMPMPGGNGRGWAAIAIGGLMLTAVVVQAVSVRMRGRARSRSEPGSGRSGG